MTMNTQEKDIIKLANDFIYHKYLFEKGRISSFFHEISIPDYIVLHIIKENQEHGCNKTYLKDLADNMQLPMSHISKMVGTLKDRGLLHWTHDGDGSDGTYVSLTEFGEALLNQHENILKEYFGNVISHYGTENLIQLMSLMKQLDETLKREYQKIHCEQQSSMDE